MGTTYFLLLIAACLGGALLCLRKVNANSYLVGVKDDALDIEQLKTQKARRSKEAEHPKVEAYVDWYMNKLETKKVKKEQRKNLGTGFIVNDPVIGHSNQRSHAVH